jgi:3'(2'), 5'-bisphosphate nucleotidase
MDITQQIHAHIPQLIDIAHEAGNIAMSFYNGEEPLTIQHKEDHSPVTSGDLAAHTYLEKQLLALFPDIPVVSEESYKNGQEKTLTSPLFWLLDPIDGTRQYINKSGDFTINVALIKDSYPIFGVIYAPLTEEMYYGLSGHGCYKEDSSGKITQLHTYPMPENFTRLVSKLPSEQVLHSFQIKWPKAQYLALSSSLKLCYLAEGKGNLYIRKNHTKEWDTAAGQCILEAAGGCMYTFEGKRLSYHKEALLNPSFIAFTDADVDYQSFLA